LIPVLEMTWNQQAPIMETLRWDRPVISSMSYDEVHKELRVAIVVHLAHNQDWNWERYPGPHP
jgi:hypothetical protein